MKGLSRSLLAVAMLTATGCGLAAPLAGPSARTGGAIGASGKAAGAAIDDLFTGLAVGQTPGAAVVVLSRGKVVHKKGYGTADLATRRPVGPDTVFDLAAVSMSFTAMAVMVLAERGALGYDEPLAKHLPQFAGPARAITIRHLLNHTAGLPDYRQLYADKVAQGGWPAGFEPKARDILGLLAEQKELDFAPGEDFGVSPSNYVVLAQVVEKVSGTRFPAFMKQHVFKPLGMARARVYDETKPSDPKRAKSYVFRAGKYENIDYSPLNLVYGDGNVNASLEDLAKWSRAYVPGTLVGAAALKQATTPPELSAGGRSRYGFGLLVKASTAGDDMLMHSGQWAGFRSAMLLRPEHGFSAFVLSNTKETAALALADEIMQQVVRR